MVKKEIKKAVKKTMKSLTTKRTVAKKKAAKSSTFFKKLSEQELNVLISKKAFEFYLDRGANHGNDHSDWYKAECFVMARHRK